MHKGMVEKLVKTQSEGNCLKSPMADHDLSIISFPQCTHEFIVNLHVLTSRAWLTARSHYRLRRADSLRFDTDLSGRCVYTMPPERSMYVWFGVEVHDWSRAQTTSS